MNDIAIRTVNLGKMYRIGGERLPYRTIRESMVNLAKRPLERIRHPGAATSTSIELWALRDVDLEVKRGEVLGIIGRNGAGKSTLLKVLSHITEPTKGRVELWGRVGSLLEVGTGFHPELTGRENIHLSAAIIGMTRSELKNRFDDIVEFSGLSRFLDTPVKRYSSGMYVRLAFAVAAHLTTEILVVDEVLAVGDAEFQRKCLGRMGEVAKGGRTVLFVSHNMPAIQSLCDAAVRLEVGRLVDGGDVESVVGRYLLAKEETLSSGEVIAKSKDGRVQLEAIRLLDSSGNLLSKAQCGRDLVIEFVLRCSVEIPPISFTIRIDDAYERRVAVLGSWVSGFNPSLREGVQSLFCAVDKFPLSAGRYSLDVRMWGGGDTLIFEPSLASLDVEAGDFHGTGKLPPQEWGGVVQIAQSWSID